MRTKNVLMSVSECRDLRHAWRNDRGDRQGRMFTRILVCDRCQTERHELLNSKGMLAKKPTYKYPATYRVPGGPLTAEEKGAIRLLGLAAANG